MNKKDIIETLKTHERKVSLGLTYTDLSKELKIPKGTLMQRGKIALMPNTDKRFYEKRYQLYVEFLESGLSALQFSKMKEMPQSTFSATKLHFDALDFTLNYIKTEGLNINIPYYMQEINQELNQKKKEIQENNKRHVPMPKFQEIVKEEPPELLEEPEENNGSTEIVAVNFIEMSTSDGISIKIPESIPDHKVTKLIKIIRSI